MSKHTKGEWFSKRDGWSTVYVECRIGGGMLQEVAACGPTANGPEEQEANARLIAAAPYLLAALIDCLPCLGWENDSLEELQREHELGNGYAQSIINARAAIARAKGEA